MAFLIASVSLRIYPRDGNWWLWVVWQQNRGKWTVRALACCYICYPGWALEGIDHMPFSPVPPITWPPCSLAFGCALSPNREFIIQCFFFFLRFLGWDKEINILEMWYHVENILQEAAVSPDDCWGSQQSVCEQTLSNHFSSVLYSGALKLQ